MAAMRVVPAFDEVEDCHAGLDLGLETTPVEQLAFERGEKALAQALSKQSPTEPIEGRTPASRQRWPKAIEVYWADSNGRRNVAFSSSKILIQGLGRGPPSQGFSRP
jgi:hypothetical protein